jgi:hypothetical protein
LLWRNTASKQGRSETRRYNFKVNRTTYLIDYRVEPAQIVVLRV